VGASLTIAMVDPTNVFAMDDIKFMDRFQYRTVVASKAPSSTELRKHTAPAKKMTLNK